MLAFLRIFFMCVVCPLGIWVQHASATRDFWLAHLMWCPAVVNWLCLIETKWNKLRNIQAILSLIRNSPMSNWTTSPWRSSIISLQSTQPFFYLAWSTPNSFTCADLFFWAIQFMLETCPVPTCTIARVISRHSIYETKGASVISCSWQTYSMNSISYR